MYAIKKSALEGIRKPKTLGDDVAIPKRIQITAQEMPRRQTCNIQQLTNTVKTYTVITIPATISLRSDWESFSMIQRHFC